jgi:hypothetical protein
LLEIKVSKSRCFIYQSPCAGSQPEDKGLSHITPSVCSRIINIKQIVESKELQRIVELKEAQPVSAAADRKTSTMAERTAWSTAEEETACHA